MFGVPHTVQVLLFFKSLGPGLVTGAVFLLFHCARGLFRHHPFVVFFEDLLFFCFSALLLYYFLFTFHAGIPRLYLLVGDALGFFLCVYSFCPLTDRLLGYVNQKRTARKKRTDEKRKQKESRRTKSSLPGKKKQRNRKRKAEQKEQSKARSKRQKSTATPRETFG